MSAKIFIPFVLLIVTTACDQGQPRMSEIQMDRLREAAPGMTENCARRIEVRGIEAMPNETDQCFHMLPKQRWRGLWRNDFEGSIFCPAPAATCPDEGENNDIWLTQKFLKVDMGALYVVEFIGRRTKVKGHYGHMGMFSHEVVVVQPISIKMITPGPPPLTEAKLMAGRRRCEAAGNCISSAEMRLRNGSKQHPEPRL